MKVRSTEREKFMFLRKLFSMSKTRRFALVVSSVLIVFVPLGILNLKEYWYTPQASSPRTPNLPLLSPN